MNTSEQLDKIGTAMAKAQAAMVGAIKGADNPFFNSKYADLTSVWLACKDAFHDNGISVIQHPIEDNGRIGVCTMLLHSSGQFISDRFTLGVSKQNNPQADGSSITYARRYALAAMAGVCPEDDDAEKAMDRGKKKLEIKKGDKNQQKNYNTFVATIGELVTIKDVDDFLKDNADSIKKAIGGTELIDFLKEDVVNHKTKILEATKQLEEANE